MLLTRVASRFSYRQITQSYTHTCRRNTLQSPNLFKSYTLGTQCQSYKTYEPDEIYRFIHENLENTCNHMTPEIKLWLLTPKCKHYYNTPEEFPISEDPFWAFYWPGGQALTRFILDNPDVVAGKRVLDLGSGCGASAIAAKMCGAKHVVANDIDNVAAVAIKLNAKENRITLDEITTDDLLTNTDFVHNTTVDTKACIAGRKINYDNSVSNLPWDVILLGDMFYDEDFCNLVCRWAHSMSDQGCQVLLADPGRTFLQVTDNVIKQVAVIDLAQNVRDENYGLDKGYILQFF